MTIAILGDCHFNCHNASVIHHEYMKKFFVEFFEYIDEKKIKTVLQLGDMFDVRKHVNTWALRFFRENFIQPCIERNLTVYVLVGNHDIFHRETVDVSSVEEVLLPYKSNFIVVNNPFDTFIDGKSFLLLPWVCKDNEQDVSSAIKNSKAKYCAGHFEFNGFDLFRGQPAKTNYFHQEYKKFDQVFSGHYHVRSQKDNVLYTGTPYQLTWSDYGIEKGFYVLDDTLTFIDNHHTIYGVIRLSENIDFTIVDVQDKHIKLYIDVELSAKDREKLIDKIYSMNPHSLKIIDVTVLTEQKNADTIDTSEFTSLSDMISGYVNNIDVGVNIQKDKLQNVLLKLLSEVGNAS